MQKKVECPICHRFCSASNIKRHVESHSRVHTVKLRPHIGHIGKGKASTEEKEE